ncbi:MAG: hypothetical protein J6M10_05770 [Clostridia bacterium]|nr:hypothetical protein [Clostridia bacterium]
MAFTKYAITAAGRNLLLACMATGDFQIKSLVLGSGSYSGIISEIQEVVNPVLIFEGDSLVVVKRENQLEVRCKLSNEVLESGFEWREYGVYATDGTSTVLFCYDNAGNDPVPITSASAGAGISNTIKVIITVDDAATVNVSFQPDPDIAIDDTVTPDGKNAVSGKAVHAFAGGGIPTPTAADSGKSLVVGEDGAYALGEAQTSDIVTDIDPGAGVEVDYPEGAAIDVYE